MIVKVKGLKNGKLNNHERTIKCKQFCHPPNLYKEYKWTLKVAKMASRVEQLHLSALSGLTGPQACYAGLSQIGDNTFLLYVKTKLWVEGLLGLVTSSFGTLAV